MERNQYKINIAILNKMFPQFEKDFIKSLLEEPDATFNSVLNALFALADDQSPKKRKISDKEEEKKPKEESKEEMYFEDLKAIFPHLKNVVIKQAIKQVNHFDKALEELKKESEKLEIK